MKATASATQWHAADATLMYTGFPGPSGRVKVPLDKSPGQYLLRQNLLPLVGLELWNSITEVRIPLHRDGRSLLPNSCSNIFSLFCPGRFCPRGIMSGGGYVWDSLVLRCISVCSARLRQTDREREREREREELAGSENARCE